MDTRSLELHEFSNSDELEKARKEMQDKLEALTKEEAEVLQETPRADRRVVLARLRKGRDRNKICTCGSGKKFKKCCMEK